ncbi:hypothetical protein DM02DRAFT_436517 [Periconia macrospinosa]|uniref:Uncharacterized protein n=1 Tax=Periconia macrospinosa TaxID=97972 RepID=A0A2V1DM50_9PLEO|nr:hypothetical protein DM02DRAFT_436517 [Periconia macrospinosa]
MTSMYLFPHTYSSRNGRCYLNMFALTPTPQTHINQPITHSFQHSHTNESNTPSYQPPDEKTKHTCATTMHGSDTQTTSPRPQLGITYPFPSPPNAPIDWSHLTNPLMSLWYLAFSRFLPDRTPDSVFPFPFRSTYITSYLNLYISAGASLDA